MKLITAVLLLAALAFATAYYFDIFDPRLAVKVRSYGSLYFVSEDGQSRPTNYLKLMSSVRKLSKEHSFDGKPAFIVPDTVPLFAFQNAQVVSLISPAQKKLLPNGSMHVQQFVGKNYLSIEFRYAGMFLSYINLRWALNLMRTHTKGQITQMLVFVHGSRCIVIGNPQFEGKAQ